jgi:hypothetical protein
MASMVHAIRTALRSIGEGEISISAYDTAMVALLKNPDVGDAPQFPSTIDWIIQNQLPDGSWGDQAFFMIRDRIISTLACVVALKTWNMHADKWERGRSPDHLLCSNISIYCFFKWIYIHQYKRDCFRIYLFVSSKDKVFIICCRSVIYPRKYVEVGT